MPVNFSQNDPFIVVFFGSLKYLVLPVICIAIHSIAYITRLTRSSMVDQLNMEYIRTAKSKGIAANKLIWKHSFKNALIPIISMLIAAIPASIAGSLVIEVIFNIVGDIIRVVKFMRLNWINFAA